MFKSICFSSAMLVPLILAGLLISLSFNSLQAWQTFGIGFLFSSQWNPVEGHFGALSAIVGTLLTTGIAVAIAIPFGFITAYYLVDMPEWIGKPLSYGLDLLASIPSVIYGMWGLFVLAPLMQQYVQPFLTETLGLKYVPFVGNTFNGFGIFTAGLVLSIMILPYISAVMRDVFLMTPALLRESAYGLGCTQWETAKDIVMRYGIDGLLGGVFIGLGRALGETMAVLFIIGNVVKIPNSVFDSGTTIAATLANNFSEADGMLRSVLFALGLILLAMSFAVQIIAQYYLVSTRANRGK